MFRSLCRLGLGLWLAAGAAVAAEAPAQDPVKPIRGAIVLFDGKNADQWVQLQGKKPCAWSVKDGALIVKPGAGNIISKRAFKDCQLHLEFWLPKLPDTVKGQDRANSGVFLQKLYEVQILDSLGVEKLGNTDCAALFEQQAPSQSAAKQPEEWQTFDIMYWAPKFDAKGKMVKKPHATVIWNDVLVLNDVDIAGPTKGHAAGSPKAALPLMLQDHGCPVRFRNIWIKPLNGG